MLTPRLDVKGRLVDESQMVGYREYLTSKHRMLSFSGEIAHETESCQLLLALDSMSKEPVKLVVDSPGGSVHAAFMLYDTLNIMRAPVLTLGREVCSAAVLLLAAGKRRYLMPHSRVMLHLVTGLAGGEAKDIAIRQAEINKIQNQYVEILRECGVKRNAKQILKDIDREFWLTPKEAIEYGLADEILNRKTMEEWLKCQQAAFF